MELAAPPRTQRSLDIIVVRNARPPEHPEDAELLAQTNQRGGGGENEKRRPSQPATVSPPAAPEPKPVPAKSPPPAPPEPPPQSPRVISAELSQPKAPPQPVPKPPPTPVQRELPSFSELLASRREEANRITAELARKAELYSNRPRRTHISASTQEYKYASYLDAWRRKVERIGNLNYPQEAKQRNLYGSLVLTVSLRSDGSVERVRLLRSSGHQLLDDSAIRIVRLAAPYSPFPAEIRKETDILEITRTWQFLNSNQLFSSD